MEVLSQRLVERLAQVSAKRQGPLLCIDTSSSVASLALVDWRQSPMVRTASLPAKALPSEGLFEAMVALVSDANLSPTELCAIGVGLGPGSFTGLRVSLASVKGIALATDSEVYGFNSSIAISQSLGAGDTWVVGDARRQSVHLLGTRCTEGTGLEVLFDVACVSYAEAKQKIETENKAGSCVRLVGDGVPLVYPNAMPTWAQRAQATPSAAWGLFSVAERIEQKRSDDIATLSPLYLQQMALPQQSYSVPV